MKKAIVLLLFQWMIFSLSLQSQNQVVCNGFQITSSAVTTQKVVSDPACRYTRSSQLGQPVSWTSNATNGIPNGFIKYSFNNPQTYVTILLHAFNDDDIVSISLNNGQSPNINLLGGCVSVSGRNIGPHFGTGLLSDARVNVSSILPFTELTVGLVAGASGIGAAYCEGVVLNDLNPCSLEIGSDTTLCFGDSLLLDASKPNGGYKWQNNSRLPTFLVKSPGKYWVDVAYDNCLLSDTINVSYSAAPPLNLGADTTLCGMDTLQLNPSVPNATYLWQDKSTNAERKIYNAGLYWLALTQGCTVIDTIDVDFIRVNLGDDLSLCDGEKLILNAFNTNASYKWQDNSTSHSFEVTQAGKYWVEVTAADCVESDTINVTYNPLPVVNLGGNKVLCEGEVITLDAFYPNASYRWSDNSTSSTLSINQAGKYWVEVTSLNCVASDTINVIYNDLPKVNLGRDTSLCEGQLLSLNVTSPNTSYKWQDNSTNSTFQISQGGKYWVELTSSNCVASDTINVDIKPLPRFDLGLDTFLCNEDILLLNGFVSNATYSWQDGSTNATLMASDTGVYWLDVSLNNCSVRDSIKIGNEACDPLLQMPNVFSPNLDGVNDVFRPIQIERVQRIQTLIYDRWGNLVYEAEGSTIIWDGADQSSGIYYWLINFTDIDGQTYFQQGSVTLIR